MRLPVGAKSSSLVEYSSFYRWPDFCSGRSRLAACLRFQYFREPSTNIDNILRVECCRMPLNGQCLPSEDIVSFFLFLPFFS